MSQDVIITDVDCGTLRGIEVKALKKNEEIVEPLSDRIRGRVALEDIINPFNDEILIKASQEISDSVADLIDSLPIETIEVNHL